MYEGAVSHQQRETEGAEEPRRQMVSIDQREVLLKSHAIIRISLAWPSTANQSRW